MSQNLNPVQPTVKLDGVEISFESLVLEQSMNSCHRFEVICEFMSQDEMWKETPQKLINRIGARASITFEHRDSGTPYEFSGWVTDVRINAWESEPDYYYMNHRSNRVHIIGEGDIVKLDGSRGMDSFVDSQLKAIVTQSTQNGGVPLDCNPDFSGAIPYVMRYQETVFEFLNRLSSTYNEMFFYDGKTLHFGQPNKTPEVTLYFDHDVFSLSTRATALPHVVSAYDYIHETDRVVSEKGPKNSTVGLLSDVTGKADQLFSGEKELIAGASPVTSNSDLQTIVGKKSKSIDGSMLSVEGQSRTCQVVLGGVVEILFPSEMGVPSLGRYRVIELVHKVDKSGNYSNHFVATPEKSEFVTQRYLGVVKAYPEMAYVKSNKDPKNLGRVQVQFEWQKQVGKNTNWIRVQTPDAGGTGRENRGMVFIPEDGDQVMIGYEFGDPNRPYVMGSVFSGHFGKGGGDKNKFHTILTKSGRKITFNDADDGGIIIEDAKGCSIELNVKDKKITIIAPDDILLQSKNITLEAKENITVKAGKDYEKKIDGKSNVEIGKDSTRKVKGKYTETVEKDVSTTIKGKQETKISKDHTKKVSGKMDLSVTKDCKADIKGKMTCEVLKEAKINSKSKAYLTALSNVYVGK